MTAPVPRRPPAAEHWCDACEDCPSCSGGRGRYPVRWRVVVDVTGRVLAVCTDCEGTGNACPTFEPRITPDR